MTTAFPSTRSSLPPDVSAVMESYTQLLMDDCKVSCEAFNHEVSQKLWNARFDCADDATLEAVFGLHSILQKRWKAKPNEGAMLKCFVRSFGKECGVFLDTSGSCGDRFWIKKEGSGLVGVFAKFRNHDELLHPLLSEVFTAWKRDLDQSCNSGHVGGSSPSSRDLDGMATAMCWLPRLLALPIVEEVQMQTTTTQTAGLIVVDP